MLSNRPSQLDKNLKGLVLQQHPEIPHQVEKNLLQQHPEIPHPSREESISNIVVNMVFV